MTEDEGFCPRCVHEPTCEINHTMRKWVDEETLSIKAWTELATNCNLYKERTTHPSRSPSPKVRLENNLKELYGFALNHKRIIKNIGEDAYIDYIYGFYTKCEADLEFIEDDASAIL